MVAKYKLLSYPLSKKTPLYGDTSSVNIKPVKQISKGDACNTFEICFSNHSGTHVDAPKHFDDQGRSLAEYNIDELIFTSPFIVDCLKGFDELVMPEDLQKVGTDVDILLIRTSFFKYRKKEEYRIHNPGISPEAARYIRQNLNLQAVGIDSISISAFQKRELGRKAHQILLKKDDFPGKPLLLIEDLNLSGDLRNLKKVFVVPVFVEEVDSMTCSVIGEFEYND